METVFTRKIEIWDEHMNTYHIYSVDRDNIKNLAAQLDLYKFLRNLLYLLKHVIPHFLDINYTN